MDLEVGGTWRPLAVSGRTQDFRHIAFQPRERIPCKVLEQVTAHQLVAERYEDSFLELLPVYRQTIRACAARAGSEACQAFAPVHERANTFEERFASRRQPIERDLGR
jgi:hypothetical protein